MVKRSWVLHGRAIIRLHANLLFVTREYEIYCMDGAWDKYTTNLIAKNMSAQMDDASSQFQLLAKIQDHQKDETENYNKGRQNQGCQWNRVG